MRIAAKAGIIAVLAGSACATSGTASLKQSPVTAAVGAELRGREQELIDAGKRHDEAALDQIIGEEFRLSGPARIALLREPWFANLRSMTWDSYDLSELEVFAWGNVAVVRSLQTLKNWRVGDRVIPQASARVTDTWVKRDGRWQLIGRISERLDEQ